MQDQSKLVMEECKVTQKMFLQFSEEKVSGQTIFEILGVVRVHLMTDPPLSDI